MFKGVWVLLPRNCQRWLQVLYVSCPWLSQWEQAYCDLPLRVQQGEGWRNNVVVGPLENWLQLSSVDTRRCESQWQAKCQDSGYSWIKCACHMVAQELLELIHREYWTMGHFRKRSHYLQRLGRPRVPGANRLAVFPFLLRNVPRRLQFQAHPSKNLGGGTRRLRRTKYWEHVAADLGQVYLTWGEGEDRGRGED